MELKKILIDNDNMTEISLIGYLDLYNVPELQKALDDEDGRNIELNCDELRYIDSAVIKLFSDTAKKLRSEGLVFRIRNMKDYILRIMDMVNVTDDFELISEENQNE